MVVYDFLCPALGLGGPLVGMAQPHVAIMFSLEMPLQGSHLRVVTDVKHHKQAQTLLLCPTAGVIFQYRLSDLIMNELNPMILRQVRFMNGVLEMYRFSSLATSILCFEYPERSE